MVPSPEVLGAREPWEELQGGQSHEARRLSEGALRVLGGSKQEETPRH